MATRDRIKEWKEKSEELQYQSFEYTKALQLVECLEQAKKLAAEVSEITKNFDFSILEKI